MRRRSNLKVVRSDSGPPIVDASEFDVAGAPLTDLVSRQLRDDVVSMVRLRLGDMVAEAILRETPDPLRPPIKAFASQLLDFPLATMYGWKAGNGR